MFWMIAGTAVLILFLALLLFFFSESKAMNIADEEMAEIEKKDPHELLDELIEVEKEEIEKEKKNEHEFYSHG